MPTTQDFLTIPAASRWASAYLHKNVTPSNIAYLMQYGRIRRLEQGGTTLVQANELGMPAVGIDISAFNALISNVKVNTHNVAQIKKELATLTDKLQQHVISSRINTFETHLAQELAQFNAQYFPSPEFKYRVRQGEIDQRTYETITNHN